MWRICPLFARPARSRWWAPCNPSRAKPGTASALQMKKDEALLKITQDVTLTDDAGVITTRAQGIRSCLS